jgi:hypothetical protein
MASACNFNPCPFGIRCRNKANHVVPNVKTTVSTQNTVISKANHVVPDVKTIEAKTVNTINQSKSGPKDTHSMIGEIKTMFYVRECNGGNSSESLSICIKMAQYNELARLGPFFIGKDNLSWNVKPWSRLDHDDKHDVYDQYKYNLLKAKASTQNYPNVPTKFLCDKKPIMWSITYGSLRIDNLQNAKLKLLQHLPKDSRQYKDLVEGETSAMALDDVLMFCLALKDIWTTEELVQFLHDNKAHLKDG